MDTHDIDLVGETFAGTYRVEAKLGEGGVGAVFRATRLTDGRPFALKVLHRGGEQLEARFEREARLIDELRHPGIVRLVDFGRDERLAISYLVMDLVQGPPLSRFVESGIMQCEVALHLTARIADALADAHQHGVIHRDLKPANIIIVGPAHDLAPVVVDFGIARSTDAAYQGLTNEGAIFGTVLYMAPEQVRSSRVGPPADVYALGATLFEMLTGRLPIEPDRHPMQTLMAKQTQVPPRVNQCVTADLAVPREADDLVAEMLAIPPEARPTMAEVAERCRALCGFGDATLKRLDAGQNVSIVLDRADLPVPLPVPRAATTRREPARPVGPDASAHTPSVTENRNRAALGLVSVAAVALGIGGVALLASPDREPLEPPSQVVRPDPPSQSAETGASAMQAPRIEQPAVDLGPPARDAATVEPDTAPPPDRYDTIPIAPSAGCGVRHDPKHPLLKPEHPLNFERLHLPENYDPTVPRPLVVVVPRPDAATRDVIEVVGFDELARQLRSPVLVVGHSDRGADDGIGEQLIRVREDFCVDTGGIFVVAIERGYKLFADEMQHAEIRGLVVSDFRYSLASKARLPKARYPVLRLSADDNPRDPFTGRNPCDDGRVNPFKLSPSAEEDWRVWRRHLGCLSTPLVGEFFVHPDGACTEWECDDGPLVTCRVAGGRRWTKDEILTWKADCESENVTTFPRVEVITKFFSRLVPPPASEEANPKNE